VLLAVLVVSAMALPMLFGAPADGGDEERLRITGFYWYAQYSGTIAGNGSDIDVNTDLGFDHKSAFTGMIDYRLGRRHHLFVLITPLDASEDRELSRQIEYQGAVFDVGTKISASLKTWNVAPGYQFDILRRKSGNLGVLLQVNLMDIEGSISGIATVQGQDGTDSREVTATGSVFAPLPVGGVQGRYYLTPESRRIYVDGFLKGMYFFDYGNYLSAQGVIGVRLAPHVNLCAGYQVGSRTVIHAGEDEAEFDVKVTQRGPIFGAQFDF